MGDCIACKDIARKARRHQKHCTTRTRVHVGYRVVRMRDGVREWWNVAIGGWSRHPPSAGWREVSPNRDWVKSVGGRVCKVFLSYGRGR